MSSPSKSSNVKYDVKKVIARSLNTNTKDNKDNLGLLDGANHDGTAGASGVTSANSPLANLDMNTDGVTILQQIAKDIDGTPSKRAAKRSKLDGRKVARFYFLSFILILTIYSGGSGFSSSASSSPSKDKVARRNNKYVPKGPPSANSMIMKEWRGGSSKAESSVLSAIPGTSEIPGANHRIPDGVVVTEHNAQKYYAIKACLFVANLGTHLDDAFIKEKLHEFLDQYGTCHIKVSRDKKQMPQAFAQFTERKHAENAMKGAQGKDLDERPIRIEWSQANGNYHLERIDGSFVSEGDARAILEPFGAIEKFSGFTRRAEIPRFDKGVFVTFENYQSGRDAFKFLENSEVWRLQEADRTGTKLKSPSTARIISDAEAKIMDQFSVIIKHLRDPVDSTDIRHLCSPCGDVMDVQLHRKPSIIDGADLNIFAYVRFQHLASVQVAIQCLNGVRTCFCSSSGLRVEQKMPVDVLYPKGSPRSHSVPGSPMSARSFNQARGMHMARPLSSPLKQSHFPSSPMGPPASSPMGPPASSPMGPPPPMVPMGQLGKFSYEQATENANLAEQRAQQSIPVQQQAHFAWQTPGYGYQPLFSPNPFYQGYPTTMQQNFMMPPAQAQVQTGAQPMPVGQYGYPGQPQGWYYGGPPFSGYPLMPFTPALTAITTPYGTPPGPTALSPAREGPLLENGAQAHLNTAGAAINHEDMHDISDMSFGLSESLSADEATTAANRVMDQHKIGLEAGVTVSPAKKDAPNQAATSVADIIGRPEDSDIKMVDAPAAITDTTSRRAILADLLIPAPLVIKKAKTQQTKAASPAEKNKENAGTKAKSTRKVSGVLEDSTNT